MHLICEKVDGVGTKATAETAAVCNKSCDHQACSIRKKVLRTAAQKADFYEYLEGVFDLYLMWKDRNCAGKGAKEVLAEMYPRSVKVRKGTHTIRCIIDASSPGINALTDEDKEREEKERSRWKNALRYAVRNRATVKQSGLGGFLEGTVGSPAARRK